MAGLGLVALLKSEDFDFQKGIYIRWNKKHTLPGAQWDCIFTYIYHQNYPVL